METSKQLSVFGDWYFEIELKKERLFLEKDQRTSIPPRRLSTKSELIFLLEELEGKGQVWASVVLGECLPERITFFAGELLNNKDLFETLVRCLSWAEGFTFLSCSRAVVLVLLDQECKEVEWVFVEFLRVLEKTLHYQEGLRQHALLCLVHLAQREFYRERLLRQEGLLEDVLQAGRSSEGQAMYFCLLLLWLLSFSSSFSGKKVSEMIFFALEKGRETTKEKIVRIIIFFFANLLRYGSSIIQRLLVGSQTGSFLESVSERGYGDLELQEELQYAQTHLQEMASSLTTFEEYISEIKTQSPSWSPTHLSEAFWEKNAWRLLEDNFDILKTLHEIILTDGDPVSVCVATHDLAQFVRYCLSGGTILKELGIKETLMANIEHSSKDVRYYSLIAARCYFTNILS